MYYEIFFIGLFLFYFFTKEIHPNDTYLDRISKLPEGAEIYEQLDLGNVVRDWCGGPKSRLRLDVFVRRGRF